MSLGFTVFIDRLYFLVMFSVVCVVLTIVKFNKY
jgi:hypothetical protein